MSLCFFQLVFFLNFKFVLRKEIEEKIKHEEKAGWMFQFEV